MVFQGESGGSGAIVAAGDTRERGGGVIRSFDMTRRRVGRVIWVRRCGELWVWRRPAVRVGGLDGGVAVTVSFDALFAQVALFAHKTGMTIRSGPVDS